MNETLPSCEIFGIRVNYADYQRFVEQVISLANIRQAGYVCIANVSSVIEAHNDAGFRNVINSADFTTPDGMPLVWGLKMRGFKGARRVCGPELMPLICAKAEATGITVGFYGSSGYNLCLMKEKLKKRFPALNIVYMHSPPFRPLAREEDEREVSEIQASGARILFVGLGCPKQEEWMASHKDKIPAVMVGVGAAFDFIAGTKKRAPAWMQQSGLEWLFRLIQEPKRLWKRYLFGNAVFVGIAIRELLGEGIKKCKIQS